MYGTCVAKVSPREMHLSKQRKIYTLVPWPYYIVDHIILRNDENFKNYSFQIKNIMKDNNEYLRIFIFVEMKISKLINWWTCVEMTKLLQYVWNSHSPSSYDH